jgi:hypothetical protein
LAILLKEFDKVNIQQKVADEQERKKKQSFIGLALASKLLNTMSTTKFLRNKRTSSFSNESYIPEGATPI